MNNGQNLGGQEKTDENANTDTPAKEASEPSNDMDVNFEGPPPSGSGGNYPSINIPASSVADSTGNVVGPK
jgi:hypothetical protein